MRCASCGAAVAGEQTACPYCGTAVPQAQAPAPAQAPQQVINYNITYAAPPAPAPAPVQAAPRASRKSKLAALILAFLFGYFGIHYFYAGRVGMGLVYLFTAGLFGIGWIVDIIRIACGNFKDSFGLPLR